ncbi:MAG: DUF1592 domain-containing protein [Planctomycetota bacterium]
MSDFQYKPLRQKLSCLLALAICLTVTSYADAQGQEERDEKRVQRLIAQVGRLAPVLKRHVEAMQDEGERPSEIIEVCEEFLDQHDEIKSDRGPKAAELWCRLMVAELEFEHLIFEAEDEGNLDENEFKTKALQLVDADINFSATEIALMDDDEEIEAFKEEINERRENRMEERDELLVEVLEELNGDDLDGDEEMEDFEVPRSDYKPIQPVKVTAAEISLASKWDFKTRVLPVLERACYDCHGGGSNEGNLDIETLLDQTPMVKHRERWDHVVAQIENRTMPPAGSNQVADMDRIILSAWFRNQLENFDFGSIRNPGFESAKRLTHEEYNNTIRDLIGIDLRPTDRLPADLSTRGGFDNNANSLFVHDGLLERYVGLAEFVVQQAFPLKSRNAQQDKAWRLLFIQTPGNGVSETDAAHAIFESFLPKVYRTKIEAIETEAMVERFRSYRNETTGFYAAILKCVQTTLVSPRFLMRVETYPDTDQAFKIEAYEMANRLSYFLWASMPDERLLRVASTGQLLNPDTLDSEVKRMLSNPKAESLGRNFAGQWLGFEHLGSRIRLDPIDNPWCTDSLMDAMKSETGMFFVSLIRDNHALDDLIDPEFTYLNEELAQFYKIPNVRGQQMRRVHLDSNQRGGIFGQSSILAVTSFPDRTSPVTRGAWVLTNVLGKRPPNPPPNASQLNEELEERDSLTQRQKMEFHRRKPNCAACHNQIDPLGFALENYDLFGRYRSRSEGRKVDAKSVLLDGTEIDGLVGLKQYVKTQKRDEVLTQLTRKLLAYALGRELEYYDEAAVQKIVAAVIEDDWKMQTLVLEIAKSYPFQYKQIQSE